MRERSVVVVTGVLGFTVWCVLGAQAATADQKFEDASPVTTQGTINGDVSPANNTWPVSPAGNQWP